MTAFTDSEVESGALSSLGTLGCDILHCPYIAPGESVVAPVV